METQTANRVEMLREDVVRELERVSVKVLKTVLLILQTQQKQRIPVD